MYADATEDGFGDQQRQHRPPIWRSGQEDGLGRTLSCVTGARVVAVDWSGRAGEDQRRALWVAETVDGELVRLENGRTRVEVIDSLIADAERDADLIVGFDFAFSFPAWYVRQLGLTPHELWAAVAREALTPAMQRVGLSAWINAPHRPFWSKDKVLALRPDQEFRRTDDAVRFAGAQPKSLFQLVGAGQVGRGSLYGMQALDRLAAHGFRIWPFDPPRMPVAVEIYPRVFMGSVTKSDQTERAQFLKDLPIPATLREIAAGNEDAFDAAVSAVAMAAAVEELVSLPDEPDYTLEGKIWQPRSDGMGPAAPLNYEAAR